MKQKQNPGLVAQGQQQERWTAFEMLACKVGLLLEEDDFQTERFREGAVSVIDRENVFSLAGRTTLSFPGNISIILTGGQ
ncbi:hypothetical protein NPIL_613991 [Nephila pilipes]|uniref:Uncharacterized protein n=1 Tax=Nephila pilipes TaxID=299642 RepID=A0A8X6PS67_NEPPI|nr:hypothetical protein NPIL_613991 [Nephila pilipes]